MAGVGVARERRPIQAQRAGWFDGLAPRVERLPLPAWLFYGSVSGLLLLWMALVAQANGREFGAGYALLGLQVVMPVALGHHFNDVARQSLRRFRPLLDLDDASYDRLEHDFLTLSTRTTAITTVVAFAITAGIIFISPEDVFLPYAASHEGMLIGIGPVFFLFGLFFGPFIVRAIRQLVWINRLHAAAQGVNPLRPGPTYAFSSLTVRVGLAMLVYGYGWLVADLATSTQAAVTIATDIGFMMIAAAFFVLPLWGMHRRLATERDAMLDAADSRLEKIVAELHRRADQLDLRDADPLSKMMASLVVERDVILKAPTWPWRPGTMNTFISLLAAPIVLFVITRLLERLV